MGEKKKLSRARTAWYLVLLAIAIPLLYLLYVRDLRFFQIPTNSMEPTVLPGDYVLSVSQTDYGRGDIVIIEDPDDEGSFLLKRIIGLSGDTISVIGGGLFLNGQYVSEPYRHEFIDYIMAPYTVKEGEVFVLGDNANWSIDSHNWSGNPDDWSPGNIRGVPEDTIVGRAEFIYLPWSRQGRLRHYPLASVTGTRS